MHIAGTVSVELHFEEMVQQTLNAIQEVMIEDTIHLQQIAQSNVDGTNRPSQLGIITGNLFNNIAEQTNVTYDGNRFIGSVGTNVIANNGFPYGAYWEGEGFTAASFHNPYPREFLHPALVSMENQFISDIDNAVNKVTK